MQEAIKAIIKRRHPENAANMDEWKFLRQSLTGGPAYVTNGNLSKHPKEDSTVYAARQARAVDHRINLTGLTIETYVGFLFRESPTQSSDLPEYAANFLNSAAQDGQSGLALAKEIARWLMDYGIVWVCVDKPALIDSPDGPLSAQQEADAEIVPYAYIVHPTHVLDGKIEGGEVSWLLVQEDERDDADPRLSTGAIFTRYRLWERDQWTLYTPMLNANGVETGEFSEQSQRHGLGCVPFVPVRYAGGSGFASKGLVADLAHMDRAIFNKCSLLDEIHYQVTFPQMVYPYDGEVFTDTGLTGQGKQILSVGLHSVIPYDSKTGKGPGFIAPPDGPAKTLAENIEYMTHMALALVLLDGEVTKEGAKAGGSGVSKAYVFEKLNRRLSEIADTIEMAFNQVLAFVAIWLGEDPDTLPDVPWEFPDKFDVSAIAEDIANAAAILGIGITSETFADEVYKRLVRKYFPKLDDDTLQAIDAEIEAGESSRYDQAATSAKAAPAVEVDPLASLEDKEKQIGQAVTGQALTRELRKEMMGG